MKENTYLVPSPVQGLGSTSILFVPGNGQYGDRWGMQQGLRGFNARFRDLLKAQFPGLIVDIDPIQKQHMQMHVQVQGAAKALDQGNRAGCCCLFGVSSLINKVSGYDPVDYRQRMAHHCRVGSKQEA